STGPCGSTLPCLSSKRRRVATRNRFPELERQAATSFIAAFQLHRAFGSGAQRGPADLLRPGGLRAEMIPRIRSIFLAVKADRGGLTGPCASARPARRNDTSDPKYHFRREAGPGRLAAACPSARVPECPSARTWKLSCRSRPSPVRVRRVAPLPRFRRCRARRGCAALGRAASRLRGL